MGRVGDDGELLCFMIKVYVQINVSILFPFLLYSVGGIGGSGDMAAVEIHVWIMWKLMGASCSVSAGIWGCLVVV